MEGETFMGINLVEDSQLNITKKNIFRTIIIYS